MQLDMDDEELPNAMLDSYISEGYMRMMSMENRWPAFESRWTVTKLGGTGDITLPADCDPAGIFSVIDGNNGMRLTQVANEQAEDNFAQTATTTMPYYYSVWGGALQLWPDPDVDRVVYIRGYRLPSNWMIGGAGAEVDADPRLHILLAHYAIALSYAQQEDEVLEDVYMKRFQAGFAAARNAICNPRHNRPLLYAGGLPLGGLAPSRGVWASPPVHP